MSDEQGKPNLWRRVNVAPPTEGDSPEVWEYVPVEPDQFQRVTQAGGMGSWRCNTCGTDCRADGPGCDGSDYDFTPSYWPDHRGEYMLIPIAGIGGDNDA